MKDTFNKQLEDFQEKISLADAFINKNYLMRLNEADVVPFDLSQTAGNIRLYQVDRFSFDEGESVNDKLISVYCALQEFHAEVILIISGDTNGITFYIGTRTDKENAARTAGDILTKGIAGNFPGTILIKKNNNEVTELMKRTTGVDSEDETIRHVVSVTTVPALRNAEKESFVQGIEKYIETMKCNDERDNYTAFFIAKPVEKEVLEQMKHGYEELYSTLSAYSTQTLTYGETEGESVSQGMYESFTESVNKSITSTTGMSSSESVYSSAGDMAGHFYPVLFGGYMTGYQSNSGQEYSSGTSWTQSTSNGKSEGQETGRNESRTTASENTKTISIQTENKSIRNLLVRIEANLARIRECESFGLWQGAAYFVSSNVQTSIVAANTFRALMAGDNSSVDNTYINQWSLQEGSKTGEVLRYLSVGLHPEFCIRNTNGIDEQVVLPTMLISGKELPFMMSFPKKSVTGLTVIHSAAFGRNIYEIKKFQNDRKISLGRIQHLGNLEKTIVELDLDSLRNHCLIVGATGSGKTVAAFRLLKQLFENNIRFLVIDPLKGEYRRQLTKLPGINILCTNPQLFQMLQLNPFVFPENTHILEHIDRLTEVFNASWNLTFGTRMILKSAIVEAYLQSGWDLQNSVYRLPGKPQVPMICDLLNIMHKKDLSSEVYLSKEDYFNLCSLVESITLGIYGQIFNVGRGVEDQILFEQNTVIDMSSIWSAEMKSLIMGLVVLRQAEYRASCKAEEVRELRHITLIEEAHTLLRRCDFETNPGLAKSIEVIRHSMSSLKKNGDGFVLLDQSPSALDFSTVNNMGTTIIMKQPDYSDAQMMGSVVSLNEMQTRSLSCLSVGEAVIKQNHWLEAVLALMDDYREEELAGEDEKSDPHVFPEIKGKMLDLYFHQRMAIEYNSEAMESIIQNAELNDHKKKEFRSFWKDVYAHSPFSDSMDGSRDLGNRMLQFMSAQNIFDVIKMYPRVKNELSEDGMTRSTQWKQESSEYLNGLVTVSKETLDELTDLLWKYLICASENER